MSVLSTLKVFLLAGIGFALGALGISAYQNHSPLSLTTENVDAERGLASACVPGAETGNEPEIFFVSCGGLF